MKKINIESGTATLLGAAIAFLGVVVASTIAQWGAANLEDRRARTELVIELMKTNDRDETLQKLRLLSASGLLPDDDGHLLRAVTAAPPTAFKLQEVRIPVAVRCVDPNEIPPEIPPVNERWPEAGTISQQVARLGIQGLELRNQNDLLRAMLASCAGELPDAGGVDVEANKPGKSNPANNGG